MSFPLNLKTEFIVNNPSWPHEFCKSVRKSITWMNTTYASIHTSMLVIRHPAEPVDLDITKGPLELRANLELFLNHAGCIRIPSNNSFRVLHNAKL